MVDNRSPMLRSKTMAAVKQKDTGPELIVRRLLHRLGYRFRLHRKDLPGRLDLVFGPRKKVLFVHGCFWHGHNCKIGKLPKSRLDYWKPKIAANVERDYRTTRELAEMGWMSFVVWQCEIDDKEILKEKLKGFLEN